MKVLFAATPLVGHVNPLLAIARSVAARGDKVIFVSSQRFQAKVEAAGFRFAPYAADGAAEHRETGLPPGPDRYRLEFQTRFIDPMPRQAHALRDLISGEKPDVIVAGSMFLGVLPLLLAGGQRPPIVVCNVSFLFHERLDGAPVGPGLPPVPAEEGRRRYAAMKAMVDEGFTLPVKAYTDALLADIGSPPLPRSLTQSIIDLPDAFLQFTVPGFEYDYGVLSPRIHFVGAPRPPSADWPFPDWWGDLDGGRRVVLVTQGTLANEDFGELVEPTLHALAGRDDLLVLATTGGRPINRLRTPLPANARIATMLPFGQLLPKVDVFVTNGGYGSVSSALQAGVPIVSAGLTEDKAEVNARIAWCGVGLNLATNRPQSPELRDGIDTVLDNPRFRRRAAALAGEFAKYDASANVLSRIDSLLR